MAAEKLPIEGQRVAAGQRFGVLGRLGVKHQAVDHVLVGAGAGHVLRAGDGDRLHDGEPEALLDLGGALGRLGAVKLQHVEPRRGDDFLEAGVIAVHHHANPGDASGDGGTEAPSLLGRHRARRTRIEDEPDGARAAGHRGGHRLRRRQPADFHLDGHGAARAISAATARAAAAGSSAPVMGRPTTR